MILALEIMYSVVTMNSTGVQSWRVVGAILRVQQGWIAVCTHALIQAVNDNLMLVLFLTAPFPLFPIFLVCEVVCISSALKHILQARPCLLTNPFSKGFAQSPDELKIYMCFMVTRMVTRIKLALSHSAPSIWPVDLAFVSPTIFFERSAWLLAEMFCLQFTDLRHTLAGCL